MAQIRKYCETNDVDIDIEVDGGVTLENASKLVKKGADILVAGVAIVFAKDYAKAIAKMKKG